MSEEPNQKPVTSQFTLILTDNTSKGLEEIANRARTRRNLVARVIIEAGIQKLFSMENPPTTLGGIENAIINDNNSKG